MKFIEEQLPEAPARVLEIGCGEGDLARALARLVAIDPRAPDGDIFESVWIEGFAGPGPFDAVVANRALYHIPSLPARWTRSPAGSGAGGGLIVHEHAWERMDEPTARWYLQHSGAIDAAAPRAMERFLAEWHADHAGLHGYAEMRAELDRRFEERSFAWTPYLYGELEGAEFEREERELIEAGTIRALGSCYVGEA